MGQAFIQDIETTRERSRESIELEKEPMKCRRCQGWVVPEQVFVVEGSVSMMRCFHCGERNDQVITANRTRSENTHIQKRSNGKAGPKRSSLMQRSNR